MTSTSSGLTMLTTGVSQYLHPDYLQPLPTTLDAKKSPLALLAQTCSAIGKDSTSSKPIIPPLEKKDNEKPDKSPDTEITKRPSSQGSKESGRDSKPGFRTFPPKEIPPLVPISNPPSERKPTPPTVEAKRSPSTEAPCPNFLSGHSSSSRPVSAGAGSNSGSQNQRSSSRSSTSKEESDSHHSTHAHHRTTRESPSSLSSHSSSHPISSSPSYSKPPSSHSTSAMHSPSSSSGSVKPTPSAHPSLLGLANPAHIPGYPHPLSLMTHGLDPSNPSYHSALAAHSSLSGLSAAASAAAHSSALKAAAAGVGSPAALSPFVKYAHVRTPSGATSLVPFCRDPLNSHLSATCNAPDCAQCAHEKTLTSLSALGLPGAAASSLLLPSLSSSASLTSNMSALSSLHSLYNPHSALAAASQGLPHICSWASNGEYCGKRFATPEELFQHLRTHTPPAVDASALASYAGLGLQHSALAAYPHLTAPLSPNSLRRSYPTSLSPVSSLLGSSRYHPYKTQLPGVPTAPSVPGSLPPVSPFYSPYALYGQRIGAAVVP